MSASAQACCSLFRAAVSSLLLSHLAAWGLRSSARLSEGSSKCAGRWSSPSCARRLLRECCAAFDGACGRLLSAQPAVGMHSKLRASLGTPGPLGRWVDNEMYHAVNCQACTLGFLPPRILSCSPGPCGAPDSLDYGLRAIGDVQAQVNTRASRPPKGSCRAVQKAAGEVHGTMLAMAGYKGGHLRPL